MVPVRRFLVCFVLFLAPVCHTGVSQGAAVKPTKAPAGGDAAGQQTSDAPRQPVDEPVEAPVQEAIQEPIQQPTPKPTSTSQVTVHGENDLTEHPEPKRILDILPNYRAVSAGTTPLPASAGVNFRLATDQAFDYSSFIFLGLTTLISEGRDTHPTLGKGPGGYGQYLWRNALDRTDRSYQINFLFPTLYHEDPRYYAMEKGNPFRRFIYAASRSVITRTYTGKDTVNFAGLSGRMGSEAVARTFYPHTDTSFSNLAIRFGYATARDAGFNVFREFYPDIAARFHHKPAAESRDSNEVHSNSGPGPLQPRL
jgi:hypothetical protein